MNIMNTCCLVDSSHDEQRQEIKGDAKSLQIFGRNSYSDSRRTSIKLLNDQTIRNTHIRSSKISLAQNRVSKSKALVKKQDNGRLDLEEHQKSYHRTSQTYESNNCSSDFIKTQKSIKDNSKKLQIISTTNLSLQPKKYYSQSAISLRKVGQKHNPLMPTISEFSIQSPTKTIHKSQIQQKMEIPLSFPSRITQLQCRNTKSVCDENEEDDDNFSQVIPRDEIQGIYLSHLIESDDRKPFQQDQEYHHSFQMTRKSQLFKH